MPSFTDKGPVYLTEWRSMSIKESVLAEATENAKTILAHKELYQRVEAQVGTPWHWVAAVHYREGDLNFKTHLANGDSLAHDTIHVPRHLMGRDGPFSWDEAAIAALKHDHDFGAIDWSSFARYAYEMEAYNGWGYADHGRTSSYLWSQSSIHRTGKYVRDGVYSSSAVDEQLGGLVILFALMKLDSSITFSDL